MINIRLYDIIINYVYDVFCSSTILFFLCVVLRMNVFCMFYTIHLQYAVPFSCIYVFPHSFPNTINLNLKKSLKDKEKKKAAMMSSPNILAASFHFLTFFLLFTFFTSMDVMFTQHPSINYLHWRTKQNPVFSL